MTLWSYIRSTDISYLRINIMTHLVILFDTLVKFKSVSVPYHLIDDFVHYCTKRDTPVYGGIMYDNYQYLYTASL